MNDHRSVPIAGLKIFAHRLWRLLCSPRLAVVLILVITIVSLAGVLIIQVFKTWWFNTLVGLLILNLAVCTINRFPPMWRSLRQPAVKPGLAFFEREQNRAQLPSYGLSRQETSNIVTQTLRRQRYRLITENDGDNTYFYAERNRYARFGTFLSHGGIILTIVAVLWGNLAGFFDNALLIPDGEMRPVGHDTSLLVLNEGFVEELYPDGRPKDYRSELVLYEEGREVKRQTVRVNEPMKYNGIRFHQIFFGNATVMRVRDTEDDNLLFEDGVALAYRDERYGTARPTGFFTLFDGRLVVDVVGTAQDAIDNFIQPWEVVIVVYGGDNDNKDILFTEKLALGQPFQIAQLEFTFLREKQFTGLSVVKDPGVNLLWVATSLIVLGICLVLYFPYRRIWVLSSAWPRSALVMVGNAPGLSNFHAEFKGVTLALEEALTERARASKRL